MANGIAKTDNVARLGVVPSFVGPRAVAVAKRLDGKLLAGLTGHHLGYSTLAAADVVDSERLVVDALTEGWRQRECQATIREYSLRDYQQHDVNHITHPPWLGVVLELNLVGSGHDGPPHFVCKDTGQGPAIVECPNLVEVDELSANGQHNLVVSPPRTSIPAVRFDNVKLDTSVLLVLQ